MLSVRLLNLYYVQFRTDSNISNLRSGRPHLPPQIYPPRPKLPAPSSNQASTHTNSDQCRCQFFGLKKSMLNVIPRLLLQNLLQSRTVLDPPYCSVTGPLKFRTSFNALGFLSACLIRHHHIYLGFFSSWELVRRG